MGLEAKLWDVVVGVFVGVRKLVGTYLCMWTQFALSPRLHTGPRVRARHPCIQVLGYFEQVVWEDPLDEIGVARGLRWSCRPHRTYDEVSYGAFWATKYVRPRSFIGVQPGLGCTRRMLPPSYSGPWARDVRYR